MDKFQNKYRVTSARASWWDYNNNAAYFITICTKNRMPCFGKIENKKLIASEIGKIVERIWFDIPKQFLFVQLGAFVVMPDHIHGIVIIEKNHPVEARLIAPLQGGVTGKNNPMLNDNLPRIIRWFKGRCTFETRKIFSEFKWQPRYHDRIIRNDGEYQRINDYIESNPFNWNMDSMPQKEDF